MSNLIYQHHFARRTQARQLCYRLPHVPALDAARIPSGALHGRRTDTD